MIEITLDSFLRKCWTLMLKASLKNKSSMREVTMGTLSNENDIQLRTIILRAVSINKRSFTFFTDYRSPKVAALQKNAQATLLLYDSKKKIQVRVHAHVHVLHKDQMCQEAWNKLNVYSRKAYATQLPPSTAQNKNSTNLPPVWESEPTLSDTAYTFENFCLLECEAYQLECLELNRTGHQRALYEWKNEEWHGHWLVA